MPTYNYQSVETGEIFRIEHSVHDAALAAHPETGEEIKRVIMGAPAVHIPGLKKHVRVDYKSPAATACGCASNVALAQAMYKNSRETPTYGSLNSKRTVTGGVVSKSSCGHSHSHGGGCGHKH
ncbi:MAG TPA: hypothetical protein VLA39_00740 [Marinobacterium sp.]|nr:hypothetical protein [Marinobacterium sp.]